MMKDLFSSKLVAAVATVGAMAAVPAAASANTTSLPSTTIFATAQGTSVLGVPVPVVGTQGFYITVPVASSDVPQVVWNAIDFTVTGSVAINGTQLVNLYIDPKMVTEPSPRHGKHGPGGASMSTHARPASPPRSPDQPCTAGLSTSSAHWR